MKQRVKQGKFIILGKKSFHSQESHTI